jgi:hypothetical protein
LIVAIVRTGCPFILESDRPETVRLSADPHRAAIFCSRASQAYDRDETRFTGKDYRDQERVTLNINAGTADLGGSCPLA